MESDLERGPDLIDYFRLADQPDTNPHSASKHSALLGDPC